MEDGRTKELSCKLVRAVDELMNKHATVTSLNTTSSQKTKILPLFRGNVHVLLKMDDFHSSIEVKEEGRLPRYVAVVKSKRFSLERFTEKQVDTFIDQLSKYKPTEGLNIPYGYVRNGVITVIFARTSAGGKADDIKRYLLVGAELPSDALFGDALSTEEWYARFWSLLGSGKIVPMRKGRETSGWAVPSSGLGRTLKRADLTSNKNLLGAGKYLLMV